MKRRLRRLGCGCLAALGIIVCGSIGYFDYQLKPVGAGKAVIVRVKPGEDWPHLLHDLERMRLIRNASIAMLFLRYTYGADRLPKEGFYEVSPQKDARTTINSIYSDENTVAQVTIPEGRNRHWIAWKLEEAEVCDSEAFLRATNRPSQYTTGLHFPTPQENLEGYLFPDTYFFRKRLGARGTIEAMLRNFESRAGEVGIQRSSQLATVVIVASMIELEVKVPSERAIVAGVIANRLSKGMPLQIDATVLYGLGKWKSQVTFADLKKPTPYNTYLIKGLPPTPICNPGLASLEAAYRPAKHNYLYYVAKGDGTHLFASTFEEHRKNIRSVRH